MYDESLRKYTLVAVTSPVERKGRVQKPTGMRYVMVNGGVTFENNECTGATPGKLLRSYD